MVKLICHPNASSSTHHASNATSGMGNGDMISKGLQNDGAMLARSSSQRTVGMDIFIASQISLKQLVDTLNEIARDSPVQLATIFNNHRLVHPSADEKADCSNHWHCRFVLRPGMLELSDQHLGFLLLQIGFKHQWSRVDKLMVFDVKPGFSTHEHQN